MSSPMWLHVMDFIAQHMTPGLGPGSVAMLVEEGKIDTANYPGLYPMSTKCHWLIEAPAEYVIKVRQMKTITVHPHFDMLSYDSDIGLMQLDIPLESNAAVKPCSDRTVLGKNNLLPNVKDDNPMLVKAVRTYYGFGGFPFGNDLALLELQKPIEPGRLWVATDLCDQWALQAGQYRKLGQSHQQPTAGFLPTDTGFHQSQTETFD
ncbi:ovochymase-1 [Grus japonensis]|uniref:Ovochymase-1 n=1 Tax=Grus japonensis TaxID=30415 RepID=A0ABC9VV05_GRUJA